MLLEQLTERSDAKSADKNGARARKTCAKLRMTVPHFALIILLCVYIVSGAAVLYKIEHPAEVELKRKGLLVLDEQKAQIERYLLDVFANSTSNANSTSLFRDAIDVYTRSAVLIVKNNKLDHSKEFAADADDLWTLSSSILFAFSLITTIGWGNTNPQTFNGKLFCILYGLAGIPFAMLVIANIGKFLSEGFNFLLALKSQCVTRLVEKMDALRCRLLGRNRPDRPCTAPEPDVMQVDAIDRPLSFLWILLIVFLYLVFGGLILPRWENLNFFDAFYFAFVSITTTGFGDIVPLNDTYLVLTLVYISVGVAFTTICIELAAGYMRKLHYVGRHISGAKFALVRFGGKEMSMSELLSVLGKKYNISTTDLHNLSDNFDTFIESAFKGQVEPNARKNDSLPNGQAGKQSDHSIHIFGQSVLKLMGAFSVSDEDIRFIDEDRFDCVV